MLEELEEQEVGDGRPGTDKEMVQAYRGAGQHRAGSGHRSVVGVD